MVTVAEYQSINPAWCPGCGDFGILAAVKKALAQLDKKPEEVLLVSGIGQAAKLPHYLRCHVFNGLHGRALPAAQAAKIANRALTVIAVGGDGDMYGEGGNHLIHAIRRNLDVTLLVHDNKIYGLTKGQASPTSDIGVRTKVQTQGVIAAPLNPLALAISQRCSFAARAFSGNTAHLAEMIKQGIQNSGFSLIEILQPCVTFNRVNTHAWYKERTYNIEEIMSYDVYDQGQALDKANQWGEKIPLGVFYKCRRDTYESRTHNLQGVVLVDQGQNLQGLREIMKNY